MGGRKIASWLRRYADQVPKEQAIVECGAWLGGGTQFLTRPAGDLHVYDRFIANDSEAKKAFAFGLVLIPGQNTLPYVKSRLPKSVKFHKGELLKATYKGPPIGLFVDDASKQPKVWANTMAVFEPHFVSGTILVLMDYDYPPCECQRDYSKKWELVEREIGHTCAAVFKVP